MTSPDAAAVDLTSLEIIRRYSLAVRQDTASRGEVVAALRADLAWLEGGSRTGTRSRSAVPETVPTTAPASPRKATAAAPVKAAATVTPAKASAKPTPAKAAAPAPAAAPPARVAAKAPAKGPATKVPAKGPAPKVPAKKAGATARKTAAKTPTRRG